MKHSIIISLVVLFTFYTQDAKAGGLGGLGFKAGFGIVTIAQDEQNNNQIGNHFRLGALMGVSYEIATQGFFALELEAQYQLKGTRDEISFGNIASGDIRTAVHYINFPVLAKFYIKDLFNFNAGAYVGVATAGKVNYTANTGIFPDAEYKIFSDDFRKLDPQNDDYLNRLDLGIMVGFEFVSKKGIGAGMRGSVGLTDVTNDNYQALGGDLLLNGSGYARTGDLSIFAIFRLGDKK